MSKLTNLKLDEFSVVRGKDVQPANPGAVAHVYKATKKEKAMPEAQTTTPTAQVPPPVMKSLAQKVSDAVRAVVKGQQTRTYTSNSTSTEVYDDGTPGAAEPEAPIVVIVQDTAPAATPTATAVDKKEPVVNDTEAITKALEAALNPFSRSIAALAERIEKIEKSPVPSAVRKSLYTGGVEVSDRGRFPAFSKFLADAAGLSPGQRISKATINSAAFGSYGLSFEESGAFLDYVVDESIVLKTCRTIKMKNPRQPVDKIGLGSTVMVPSTVGVDPGDTTSISTSQVMLSTKDAMAIAVIGDDTLQDNIEGDEFVQHLLGMVSRAMANELEAAAIFGDTSLSASGVLNYWDGFYKQAKAGGAHVIEGMADSGGSTPRAWAGTNGAKMTKLIKALPTKYRRDMGQMRLILHPDLYLDYADTLTGIASVPAFQAVTGGADVPIRGVQHLKAPGVPRDFSFTYSSTNYSDGTFAMLTNPMNLIVGIHQDVKVEPYREPRKRQTSWVITIRQDVKIENADAIAIYDHEQVQ